MGSRLLTPTPHSPFRTHHSPPPTPTMNLKRRGAETGSGFQETVNRINEGYERAGRAYVTRKAIPGKYLIERGESRRGLSLPIDFASSEAQPRLSYAELSRLREAFKAADRRRFVPESKAEPD